MFSFFWFVVIISVTGINVASPRQALRLCISDAHVYFLFLGLRDTCVWWGEAMKDLPHPVYPCSANPHSHRRGKEPAEDERYSDSTNSRASHERLLCFLS